MAKYEHREFKDGCKVWVGKYRGLRNMPHWHFENEIVSCSEGSAKVIIDGETYTLGRNMCIYIHRESTHYIEASPDSNVIVAQYDSSVCGCTAGFRPVRPLFEDKYDAYHRINEMLRELQIKNRFYADNVNYAMAQLAVHIFRGEELVAVESGAKRAMVKFKELLEVIDREYDNLTFSAAAKLMNMSKANFSRLFKKTFHTTFSQYVNTVRVSKAIEIMNERPGITMTALMMECGFNTLRNFNRVFKEVTGYPPSRLPPGFVLNQRALSAGCESFDPTLDCSELLH